MAEKSAFNDWSNVVSEGRNNLVFEKRHKDYGAYDIRQQYNRIMTRALLISITSVILLVAVPKIIDWISNRGGDEVEVPVDMSQIDLEAPPPVDESEPPPPPPPPPPVMETVKFTPPVVVDEEVIEEQPIITQETETQISTVTQEGTGTEEIIIPEETGTGVVEEAPETPLIAVEEMPSFPGGEEAMFRFLRKNTTYPAMEKEAGITGTVHIRFVVNKEGLVTSVEVLKGVKGGAALDREAVRVVQSMPKWSAGKQNGRAVPVYYNLPVKFSIQ